MISELKHYGTPRHSGRYPYGSGEDPYQRTASFLSTVRELKRSGMSEKDIADGMGMSIKTLRARISSLNSEKWAADSAKAYTMKERGYSNMEIGRRMGINESQVRRLLNPSAKARQEITKATADMLQQNVDSKRYIDVGIGVERYVGVSRTKFDTAIQELVDKGYKIHYLQVEQLGTGKPTSIKVLGAPDTTIRELSKDLMQLQTLTAKTDNGGRTYTSVLGFEPIKSVNSDRIMIRYGDEGGTLKDGVIELRRGVEDLNLGDAKYAQVRIGVNDTHYLKGMAIYTDNLPDGIDIIFNTNKNDVSKMDTMKPLKKDSEGNIDQNNPFGASLKREVSEEGVTRLAQRGALNVVNEEGDWSKWSKTISSQMLSKQSPALAKEQLTMAYDIKKSEFDSIKELTNPAVKKYLLDKFADGCDSDAVHLDAAALPRQAWKVILPVTNINENEIYAPTFRDGEKVVLIRHPHGGIFEIPQVTVNNRSPDAKAIMEQARDAIGIHPNVAKKLSGADFDGDSVLVIPDPHGRIKTSQPIKSLQNFDPQTAYPAYDGMPKVASRDGKWPAKTQEMGNISNLITDMTIKGAPPEDIVRAVKHSMVIIDAEKHNLNYKQSAIDNGIDSLKETYQGGAKRGASTVISRAGSEARIPERKEGAYVTDPITGKTKKLYVDPNTGEKLYTTTGATYEKVKVTTDPVTGQKIYTPTGVIKKKETITTKMDIVSDAKKLSSGTVMETVYADYANKMKALGNEARKESVRTGKIEWSPSAKTTYSAEVQSLKSKLDVALRNAPLERQAQALANAVVTQTKQSNPHMDRGDIKKVRTLALNEARSRVGAGKVNVKITPNEWKAIQSGAISNNTLVSILKNTDLARIREYATPIERKGIAPSVERRAKAMLKAGYTQAEVSLALGVSTSTIADLLK